MAPGVYPSATRIWERTEPGANGCLLYTGLIAANGYGHIQHKSKHYPAHRLALELTLGRTLARHEWALHKCDVRHCINPEHLYVGDGVQNQRDARERGRKSVGERSGTAKLSAATVLALRAERARGVPSSQIARRLGVSKSAVVQAVAGRTWRHLMPTADIAK